MATWTEINTYFLPLERGLFFGDADLYWDDLSADESNRLPIVFIDRDAWYWNSIKGEHRPIIVNNSLTFDGRDLLDRLLHVSPPMVDYSL